MVSGLGEGRALSPLEQKFRVFLLLPKYLVRCLRAEHLALVSSAQAKITSKKGRTLLTWEQ